MSKNVFFVTHQHKENDGGDESASKYNMYEVSVLSCAYDPILTEPLRLQ